MSVTFVDKAVKGTQIIGVNYTVFNSDDDDDNDDDDDDGRINFNVAYCPKTARTRNS